MQIFEPDITDSSSSHSDDTTSGGGGGGDGASGRTSRGARLSSSASARRRKGALNAKERNLRRLESNERERMRMHSLNDAFQVNLSQYQNASGSHVDFHIFSFVFHHILLRLYFLSLLFVLKLWCAHFIRQWRRG